MKRMPKPSVKFENHVSAWVQPPMTGCFSGELKASTGRIPLGLARFPGSVANCSLSAIVGKDNAQALAVAVQFYINDVSVCSTPAAVAHVSGEAAQVKTTKGLAASVTGKTIAVLGSDLTVSEGDILSYALTLTRTATPTTEIKDVSVMVEIEPNLPV